MKPTQDIQSLTAFRANVSSFVDQVRQTRRPLVLTQHGQSAAVLMGAADYEALIDEVEVLRDISISQRELSEGKGIPHEDVRAELLKMVRERTAK